MERLSMAELARRARVSLDVTRRVQGLGLLSRGGDGRYSPADVALLQVAVSGLHLGLESSALRQGLTLVRGAALDPGSGWDVALVTGDSIVLGVWAELAEQLSATQAAGRTVVVVLS